MDQSKPNKNELTLKFTNVHPIISANNLSHFDTNTVLNFNPSYQNFIIPNAESEADKLMVEKLKKHIAELKKK